MTTSPQLLPISSPSNEALDKASQVLALYLQQNQPTLADVAYTLQTAPHAPFRRVLVSTDAEEAIQLLNTQPPQRVFNQHTTHQGERELVFMFPGIGDHYPRMGQKLYENHPIFKEAVDTCDRFLTPLLGQSIIKLLYTEAPKTEQSQNQEIDLRAMLRRGKQKETAVNDPLQQTQFAHPTVFTIEYALAQLLISWGYKPSAFIGYSLGEYVCACLAGVLDLEATLTLVAKRAQLIESAPKGSMLAVSAGKTAVTPYLSDQVSLSAYNGVHNSVLAGEKEAIEAVQTQLKADGLTSRLLDTTHAFHSHMLQHLADEVTALAEQFTLKPPQIPYVSNVTGQWITAEEATDPAYWARHMINPVLCMDGLGTLLNAHPSHILLEVGPGQSIGSFAKQHPDCTREQVAQILPSLPYSYDNKPADIFLLETVGKLWLLNASPNWDALQSETPQTITLPPPFSQEEASSSKSKQASSRGAKRRERMKKRGRR